MSLTCPACRKADQAGDRCERCGCDLTRLRAIDEAASGWLVRAETALREGRREEARAAAARSWSLRHSSRAAQVAFVAASAGSDTGAALAWRRRALG